MFIEIDGEVYSLDLNKMSEFVFESKNKANIETNIAESYSINDSNESLEMVNKTINENKIYGDSAMDNIKYDLIKMLLDILVNAGNPRNNQGMFVDQSFSDQKYNSLENMSLGEIIAFNTFLNEGFLIKLK